MRWVRHRSEHKNQQENDKHLHALAATKLALLHNHIRHFRSDSRSRMLGTLSASASNYGSKYLHGL